MRVPQAFDSCLRPFRRFNHTSKQYSYCACGSCLPCIQKKQKKWEYRLFDHMRCGLFSTLFITLTYDNEHLPLVYLDDETFAPVKMVATRFRSGIVKDGDSFDYVSAHLDTKDFQEFINDEIPDINARHIIHYVDRRYKNGFIRYNDENCFGVCYKKDVQDFVARLRSHLARVFKATGEDTRFTYFICSEYGPKTFRPHYHGILFFNSQAVAEYANTCGVFKAWSKQSLPIDSYGNKISTFVNNAQASAAYVSKYVTGYTHLPALLHYKGFRPFHLQSISVPIGSYAISLDSFADMLASGNMLYEYSFKDKLTQEFVTVRRPFADSCLRRFFPKFLCHSCLDVSTIRYLLRRILSFSNEVTIPDYRAEIESKYDVWKKSTFNILNYEKRHFRKRVLEYRYFPFTDVHHPFHDVTVTDVWYSSHSVPLPEDYRNTPATVAPLYLRCCGASYNDFDRFLFGFDFNRGVFKKLRRLAAEYPWILAQPEVYINLYFQYYDRVSAESFRKISEFVENACPSGKFTPDAYAAIYFDSLPSPVVPIQLLASSEYDRFDRCLSQFSDLSVEDFYDLDTGLLKFVDVQNMPFYQLSKQNAIYKREKDKSRKLEKHDASFNL